jgi:chorismate mutase
MKKLAGLFTVALLLLAQAGAVFAQVSDYEIIESFKNKQQYLLASIKAAQSLEQCAALETQIGELESAYAKHRKLLADGLYPGNLDSSVAALREQLNKSSERISLAEESKKDKSVIQVFSAKVKEDGQKIEQITRQNEEYKASLDKLTQEVNGLNARIRQLSTENAGLVESIRVLKLASKKDSESIAQMKALTEKLNANIRDRDELVMKMMDSLFGEYSKAGLTDAQKKNLFANIQGNDYVGKLVSTLDENVKYSESALFSAQDMRSIRDEQKKLSDKWNQIKPYVAKLYPDEQSRVRDIASVDSRVSDWKMRIDETMWKSIYHVFSEQKVDVGTFSNAGEFHARVLAYIDQQMRNPSRDAYQAFKRIWESPIRDQWLPAIPTEELSQQQRNEIEARITRWDKKVSALFLRWVLIAVAAIAVLAVVLVLTRKKKPTAAPPAENTPTG